MKEKKFIVRTKPQFLPAQSNPERQEFVWTYEISIQNLSDDIVQLLNRRWLITDLSGRVEEVQGAGVVGLQPLIKPGKTFSYASFCRLNTPQGTMEGEYELQDLDENVFFLPIPKFILTAPSALTQAYRSILH